MSINAQTVYDRMVDTFGVDSNSERFQNQFFRAVNDVSRDLHFRCWQSIDAIDDLQDAIDADSDMFENCYVYGVKYALQSSGEWGTKPDEDAFAFYQNELKKAQTLYLVDYEPLTRWSS